MISQISGCPWSISFELRAIEIPIVRETKEAQLMRGIANTGWESEDKDYVTAAPKRRGSGMF